ncbi:hypothetical protein FNF27_01387 [Cafeteria roenbergensis]|nr:hypothetical protein FNF29_05816 [Cafeteria roenbergensis]KAA0177057.1 hypothetical protein FNF27_01387 [Cafeteria roenbergensis]|eukprot:KAA0149604.1 hypothetical protein FNF29_05816 [Cafeteria roenbergensis]
MEQAEVSREVNTLLTADGGLNEASKRSVKSLEAAIAKSRQPGYFKYYTPSDATRAVETKNVLSAKVARLAELQKRVDAKQAQLDSARREAAKPTAAVDVPDLRRWFARYDRPAPAFGGEGAATTFSASRRVFGGTKHYPGFRSVASDMRPGRALR